MELWIRSQNKEILQKTNALFIAHSEENIWSIIDNQNMTKYGTYKTYERALEVLDEIQSLIDFMVCKEIFTYDSEEFMQLTYKQIKHIEENGCIYQMPEE